MKRLSKTQRAAIREHIQYEEASVREVGPSNATTELSDALRAALEVIDSLTEALRDREAQMREAVKALEMPWSASLEEACAANLRAFEVLRGPRKPFKPEGET